SRSSLAPVRLSPRKTALPLWSSVCASAKPSAASRSRRAVIATMLRPPTLMPRKRAMCVAISSSTPRQQVRDEKHLLAPRAQILNPAAFGQPALGVKGGHAAGAGRRHRLAVVAVGHVAGREHAFDARIRP